jgi:hypothetical protein
MNGRRRQSVLAGVLMVVAVSGVACSSQPSADIPRIEEKTYAVTPPKVPVQVGILSGQLGDLTVVQRVNAETGEVVYAPQLRGTLTLKNTSTDQTVRLVDGEVAYLDGGGAPIALTKDRTDTRFSLSSYSSERLAPGTEVRHSVDVPFPATALKGKALAEIRLNVSYIPASYREVSVDLPVALAERR